MASCFNCEGKGEEGLTLKQSFAIEIESVERFKEPIDPWDSIPQFVPPQSFYYIDSDIF